MPDPQLIQVNKYPNRRLYDQTRSRHITHDDLFDLVVAGHTVMVTESKTGTDITNLVLAQALIERSPEKFTAFPPEVLHLMIRASEQMLRGMASGWFAQIMKGMGSMSAGVPGAGAATPPWMAGAGLGWGAPQAGPAPVDAVADLRARMEAMMRELADLKGAGDKAS